MSTGIKVRVELDAATLHAAANCLRDSAQRRLLRRGGESQMPDDVLEQLAVQALARAEEIEAALEAA